MRRATTQEFNAVISERAPDTKDLAASQELEKFLKAMGLYEDDAGSKRRKVSSTRVRGMSYEEVNYLTSMLVGLGYAQR